MPEGRLLDRVRRIVARQIAREQFDDTGDVDQPPELFAQVLPKPQPLALVGRHGPSGPRPARDHASMDLDERSERRRKISDFETRATFAQFTPKPSRPRDVRRSARLRDEARRGRGLTMLIAAMRQALIDHGPRGDRARLIERLR